MKFTTYEQLKKITKKLWDDLKAKIDVSYKEATLANKTITLTKHNNQTTTLDLTDYVTMNQVGNEANKIPQVEATGKLPVDIIPDLAITDVKTAENKNKAKELVTTNAIQVGDVVIVTNEKNAVYMCKATTTTSQNPTFEDYFLKLSIGDGTVTSVNGLVATNGDVILTGTLDTATDATKATIKINNQTLVDIPVASDADITAITNQFV